MKYSLKKITSRTLFVYSCVNVLTYLFAHIAYLFINDTVGEIFEYVSYYMSKSVEFLAPPILATLALSVLICYGKGALVKFSLTVTSARILYTLPYYYMIFINNYGYDSVESITLSLLASILTILLTVIGIFICLGIYFAVLKICFKKSRKAPDEVLDSVLEKSIITDFLCPKNVPVLIFALARFCFSLARELFDAVSYMVEYYQDYRSKEIVTMLANFVLIFLLLVASYLISAKIKNALIKDTKE